MTIRHGGVDHEVTCDLLVLADGRLSGNAARVGAQPYQMMPSPWFSMLAYYEDLPLRSDRGYFSLGKGSVLIGTPSSPRQWCISTATGHDRLSDGADAMRGAIDTYETNDACVLGEWVITTVRFWDSGGSHRIEQY